MTKLTIQAVIDRPVETVWEIWNAPEDIKRWNAASDDWHTTASKNDLTVGGQFTNRMEAKDGSMGFDFTGTYETIVPYERIAYVLEDGRQVTIDFSRNGQQTEVVESFDAETSNPPEMQQAGWQAILDRFKAYAESK